MKSVFPSLRVRSVCVFRSEVSLLHVDVRFSQPCMLETLFFPRHVVLEPRRHPLTTAARVSFRARNPTFICGPVPRPACSATPASPARLTRGLGVWSQLAGFPGGPELPQLRLRVTSENVARTVRCQQRLLRGTVLETHDVTLRAALFGFEAQVSIWLLLLERRWDCYIFCPEACVWKVCALRRPAPASN